MQWMRVANYNGSGSFFGGLGNIDGTLNGTGRSSYEEFAMLVGKLAWLLDCPGFCHVLAHRLAGGTMIPHRGGGRPDRTESDTVG
jgi:hypothetical protein